MSLGENQSTLHYIKATPVAASATVAAQVIRSSAGALSSIIIGSHSLLVFKLWDSATGPGNPIHGSFTPAAGSQVLDFSVPIEFTNGLYMTSVPETANTGSITFNVN